MSINDLARALGAPESQPEYVPSSAGRIPIERWGKDHWSTFAYLETRIVDHAGRIAHDHMRCDIDRHPFMHEAKKIANLFSGDGKGTKYPTRLKGTGDESFELLQDHDDYDCLDDMIAAGLVTVTMPPAPEDELLTGLVESRLMTRAVYALTERGKEVAGQLRGHKGDGGNFHHFEPKGA